jgi:hypothetical protein
MTRDRLLLAAVGAVLLVVGLWPHRDRPTLAVTLVVAGAVLAALGALLPYVRNIQGEVGGFSLQLALVQLPAPLSTEPLGTLRGEVLPDSGSRAFSVLLRHPAPIAYSVVSLGDGQEWLTSRLLVFAVVLQELRDARCFVFTKRVGESGPDQFVGTVQPDDLRRCFAWRYPWLTAAMAQAWERSSPTKLVRTDLVSRPRQPICSCSRPANSWSSRTRPGRRAIPSGRVSVAGLNTLDG